MSNAELQAKNKLAGAFDLFGKSSDAVKANLRLFVILNIPVAVFTVLGLFSNNSTSTYHATNYPFPTGSVVLFSGLAIIGIAVFVMMYLFQVMLTKLQLEASKGTTPQFSELWNTAKKYWLRLLGLYIVVGLTIAVGFVLFIIPGLIFLRRYYLSSYFLLDKDLAIKEAMRQSAAATKPYSGYVWSVLGVMFLISLLGVIPILGGLASFVLGIFYSVAPALRYQELKNLT